MNNEAPLLSMQFLETEPPGQKPRLQEATCHSDGVDCRVLGFSRGELGFRTLLVMAAGAHGGGKSQENSHF